MAAYMRSYTVYLVMNERGSAKAYTRGVPTVHAGEVCMKLKLELPNTLFRQPSIEAKITVPKEDAEPKVVSTAALDKVKNLIHKDTGMPVKIELVGFPDEDEE